MAQCRGRSLRQCRRQGGRLRPGHVPGNRRRSRGYLCHADREARQQGPDRLGSARSARSLPASCSARRHRKFLLANRMTPILGRGRRLWECELDGGRGPHHSSGDGHLGEARPSRLGVGRTDLGEMLPIAPARLAGSDIQRTCCFASTATRYQHDQRQERGLSHGKRCATSRLRCPQRRRAWLGDATTCSASEPAPGTEGERLAGGWDRHFVAVLARACWSHTPPGGKAAWGQIRTHHYASQGATYSLTIAPIAPSRRCGHRSPPGRLFLACLDDYSKQIAAGRAGRIRRRDEAVCTRLRRFEVDARV